jgi:ABC-type Na+ transport system ATPase subunit NatA
VKGRVAALLELGSGFNPEFTGRENVYLNGAILGLSRDEIDARFDDIAAFADIGEFIDQPVKFYSSGMVVRLAFAVQAHIEPDILIVDEALAVGDVYFQHKCMKRIKKLIDTGTTLLLVSHSTGTIKSLCSQAIWLEQGVVQFCGASGLATERYLAFMRMRESGRPEALANVSDVTPELDMQSFSSSFISLLPKISSEIDLSREEIFLRGDWTMLPLSQSVIFARQTSSSSAVAGFKCFGDGIRLVFAKGPVMKSAKVVIDGDVKVVPLNSQYSGLEPIYFAVSQGEHSVLISPNDEGPGKWLCWVGGQVSMNNSDLPMLPFYTDVVSSAERYGNGKARIMGVELLDYTTNAPLSEVSPGQTVRLRIFAERLMQAGPRLEFSFIVQNRNQIDLFGATTIELGVRLDCRAQKFLVEFVFDIRLAPGSYSILVAFVECSEDLMHRIPMDQINMAKVFTVSHDPEKPIWYIFKQPMICVSRVSF